MPASVRLRAANYEAMRLAFARLRQESGLSYESLATASGLSRMTLINLEHGVNRGSLETWYRVCQVLKVPLSDVVAHLDDPLPKTRTARPKT